MKKNTLSTIALAALAAFTLPTAALAVGGDGDIRSIQAVPIADYGETGNILTPLRVGETFYVRVRLLNEKWMNTLSDPSKALPWVFERNEMALPSDWKDVLYRPALRLAIGSKKVNAEFTWTGPEGETSGLLQANDFYTDLYFSYTVKEGELGQPVRFVNARDEIVDKIADIKEGFNLLNVNTLNRTGGYWDLKNNDGTLASFWFGPASPDPDPQEKRTYPDADGEHMDVDKVYPGIYVKTIDFVGKDGDVGAGIWRQVYQGIDDEVGKELAISGVGTTTVYIWSGDETVAVPEGDTEQVSWGGEFHTVAKVQLRTTGENVPIKLQGGMAAEGSTCQIYLCSQKKPATDANGNLLLNESTISRTIQLVAAPPPFMTVSRVSDGARSGIIAEATTNYSGFVQMQVTFSKPYDAADVRVHLGLSNDEVIAGRYAAILPGSESDPVVDASIDEVTVPKGERTAYFYIFPLGSTDVLKKDGFEIVPSVAEDETPEAKEAFAHGEPRKATIKLTDQVPEVIAQAPQTSYDDDLIDLDITLADNWRDLQPALNPAGYSVQVEIAGTRVLDTNKCAFVEGDPLSFSVRVPSGLDGLVEGVVRVWDPTHTRKSDCGTGLFKLTVTRKPEFVATPCFFASADEDAKRIYPGSFCEGDQPIVRVVLTQPPVNDTYAFLTAINGEGEGVVDLEPLTKGLLISRDNANPTNSSPTALTLLDGDAKIPHATTARLKVVLKDKPTFDDPEAKTITTYDCKSLVFNVTNATPTVDRVWKGTAATGSRIFPDTEVAGKLPSGALVTFTAKIFDPGQFDLADSDQPIKVRWVYTDGPDGENPEQPPVTTDVLPNGYTTAQIPFYQEGSHQTVSLYVQDRDTRSQDPDDWGEILFTFNVVVGARPQVSLTYPSGNETGVFYENGSKSVNKLIVKIPDDQYPSVLDHFEGDEPVGTATNPLIVELTVDNEYHVDDGCLKLVDPQTAEPGWVVTNLITKKVVEGQAVTFDINTQNGGEELPSGFMVTARILNKERNKDGVAWRDYFEPITVPVSIMDIAPTIKLGSAPGDKHSFSALTNTWTAGEEVSLQWLVKDIMRDLKSDKFSIGWTLTDKNGQSSCTIDPTTITGTALNAQAIGTYTFVVPNSEVTEVTVTAFDGDGLEASQTFYIRVIPTKPISINVFGPSYSTETKYDTAAGLGKGHIYVEDSTRNFTVRQFRQTWQYSEASKQAHVFAVGYAADQGPDDGNLDPGYTGAPLTPAGGKWTSGERYNYANDTNHDLDNFFYCWAVATATAEEALTADSTPMVLMTPQPAKKIGAIAEKYFMLDNEKPNEGTSYGTVSVEAIFSHEMLKSDNMGDINLDGVPDLYAKKYGFGIFGQTNGEEPQDDLKRLTDYNDDGDYLPNTMTAQFAGFIPGLSNTWVSAGRAFRAKMEIRGYDDNLNDAALTRTVDNQPNPAALTDAEPDRCYKDPDTFPKESTLSKLEYIAYTNWCARTGKAEEDWGKEATWKLWSPERPSNPTLVDSDYDEMPDGYEYYFWYKAHVGWLEDGKLVRASGRKYNPANPCEPTTITADEIEKLYDPIIANDFGSETDTDNDGLPDLVEFSLGTNPLDYDTDGDGLPDGYEVAITKTDPLKAATNGSTNDGFLNPDGDKMALYLFNDVHHVKITYANDNTKTNDVVILSDYTTDEEGSIVTPVDIYERWRYNSTLYALGHVIARKSMGELLFRNAVKDIRVVSTDPQQSQALALHFQLYDLLGYDPRTGWNEPVIPDPLEHTVNTASYENYDEFMSLAFFVQADTLAAASVQATANRPFTQIWSDSATNPNNADTDADGMPDGWEFYIMTGGGGPGNIYSPLYDFGKVVTDILRDPDSDGLDVLQEYCATESCAVYAGCETIRNLNETWQNKYWPTDPFNADTDGDGMIDGDELKWYDPEINSTRTWVWTSVRRTDKHDISCIDGGGLNPCSWDTDFDGLPDPWEAQFIGDLARTATAQGMTTDTNLVASASTDVLTTTNATEQMIRPVGNGMNPTAKDSMRDYDNDGLDNWQEYMVGSMRCWRYDDTTTPWRSLVMSNEQFQAMFTTGEEGYRTLVEVLGNPWTINKTTRETNDVAYTYNPGLRDGHVDPGVYFSYCTNTYDLAYGTRYMLIDGINHDLVRDTVRDTDPRYSLNRWTIVSRMDPNFTGAYLIYDGYSASAPSRYATCDPRMQDTDGDGMDDYYELFHGLNPLLGAPGGTVKGMPRDMVYIAWGGGLHNSAVNNHWLYKNGDTWVFNPTVPELGDVRLKDVEKSQFDFVQFPWLAGLPYADPDGDNVRNQQEAIMPSVQAAPTYQHTDPTPLWMTETAYDYSLTHRFYYAQNPPSTNTLGVVQWTGGADGSFKVGGVTYNIKDFPALVFDQEDMLVYVSYDMNQFACNDTLYSYEENEGFDTDHDFLNDFEEAQGRTKPASDAQQHDDPYRNQAMWFDGVNSFLQSPLLLDYMAPDITVLSEQRQDFLYYTVEAWVKPDAETIADGKLHTVIERAVWTGESNAADENFLRKNFLIGVRSGRWFAKFDSTGTDLKQAVEINDGPVATTNWTHVALSYGPAKGVDEFTADKMALILYVDGKPVSTIRTAVQPEHGEAVVVVNGAGQLASTVGWAAIGMRPLISVLVGASAATRNGIVCDMEWEMSGSADTNVVTKITDYDNFFKGYIDEVRVWDGARKEADILHDVVNRVRYTDEIAAENREDVYKAWAAGARRTGGMSQDNALPAELRFHWAFDHITGAVQVDDVVTTPTGFATNPNVTDTKAVWSRPEGWQSAWLASVDESIRSTVYTDLAWIPWLNDTVSHLPRYDGTTFDSVYWAETRAGAITGDFRFPRAAEPFSRMKQQLYYSDIIFNQYSGYTQLTGLDLVSTNATELLKLVFAHRNCFAEGADLIPFGGAYPKRISAAEGGMWDTGAAADAWAQTGADVDNNGLPEWWEKYARKNYAKNLKPWDPFDLITQVTYEGMEMTAREAYLRDLARGILPDGERYVEFADTRDNDRDSIPDWWENIFGIDTHSMADAYADPDNDRLSNLSEYLISEVFRFGRTDPDKERTDLSTIDYFLKVGSLYLGEIFSDHDQMSDIWEVGFDPDYIDSNIYDPLDDKDGDGWSNYAETRAGTDPTTDVKLSIDGYMLSEYPVPVIEAKVIYNGTGTILSPIVFKAWSQRSDPDMTGAPDAIWTLGSPLATTAGDAAASGGDAGGTTATSGLTTHEKFLGKKPRGTRTYYLGGGSIAEGTLKLEFLDKGFGILIADPLMTPLALYSGEPDDALWYYGVYDRGGKLMRIGNAFDEEEYVIGTVDYETGCITIDFDDEFISGRIAATPDTAVNVQNANEKNEETIGTLYHILNLDESYVRITWKSAKVPSSITSRTYFLTDADPVGEGKAATHGHIREGLNSFVCFVDEDGDGEYTPGELFGFIRDVDVGWSNAKVTIEVTETSPIFGRVDLVTGENDRKYWYGTDSGNFTNLVYGSVDSLLGGIIDSSLSGGKKQRIRIDRYAVNGLRLGPGTNGCINVSDRVLVDKTLLIDSRSYIHEGDILEEGVFDIDWEYFVKDVMDSDAIKDLPGRDVTTVAYRVVVDSEDLVHPMATNRMMQAAFTRVFDSKNARHVPTNLVAVVEYGAHPTFTWTMNGFNTYTAFKVRIQKGSEVVYESPMTRVPPMDMNGNYVWEAPVTIGDQTSLGKILERAGNYTWSVSMYNAKFRTDAWSQSVGFTTVVVQRQITDTDEHGAINVAVRYAGPGIVVADSGRLTTPADTIRVQAFTNPDFSGVPAAQGYVSDLAAVTNLTDETANATLYGLKAGTYYIRAYIDTNGNFEKDDWESWGEGRLSTEIAPGRMANTVTVYIDDADTDGDWLPDAWEMKKYGSLAKKGAEVDETGVLVRKFEGLSIERTGADNEVGILSTASLPFFNNLNSIALLLDLPVSESMTSAQLVTMINLAIQPKVVDGSVKITDVDFDNGKGELVLTVSGETEESEAGRALSSVLTVPTGATVTVSVFHKSSLAEKEWKEIDSFPMKVSSTFGEQIRVLFDKSKAEGGFVQIKIIQ